MNFFKKIAIISFVTIFVTFNIMISFAKPLIAKAAETESAVAIPIAELSAVVWELLMITVTAAGAVGIHDNYEVQKEIYGDFMYCLQAGSLVVPSDGEIGIINDKMEKYINSSNALNQVVNNYFVIEGGGGEPPKKPKKDDSTKPDLEYWQQLGKKLSFKTNGAFLSTLTNYVSDLFKDTENPVSQAVFGNAKFGGSNGKLEFNSQGYQVINMTSRGSERLDGSNICDFKMENYLAGYETVFVLEYVVRLCMYYYNPGTDTLNIVKPSYFQRSVGNTGEWTSCYDSGTPCVGQIVASGLSSYGGFVKSNTPIFIDKSSAKNFLKTGNTKGCLNLDPMIDYQVGINQLGNTLHPLTDNRTSLGALTDTMSNVKQRFDIKPAVDTDDYVLGFAQSLDNAISNNPLAPLPKPEFKPTPSPDYPSLDENTPEDKKNTLRDWSRIFPFCIPFDIVDIYRTLEAEPKAPKFEWLFKIRMLDFEYLVVIDLAMFDSVAKVLRTCELITFIVVLGFASKAVIKW